MAPGTERVSSIASFTLWLMPSKQGVKIIAVGAMVEGGIELWVTRVKPGRILFELDGVPVELAKEALALAAAKLPIKTRFIQRITE